MSIQQTHSTTERPRLVMENVHLDGCEPLERLPELYTFEPELTKKLLGGSTESPTDSFSDASNSPWESTHDSTTIQAPIVQLNHFTMIDVVKRKSDGTLCFVKQIQKHVQARYHTDHLSAEIGILRKLHHPRIVETYHTYQDECHVLIVMEYIKGGDLFSAMETKQYTQHDLCLFTLSFIDTLYYIHDKGIIHRDLKLENIMLTRSGDITSFKIIDFGLSVLQEDITRLHEFIGTLGYTPPEIYLGYTQTKAVDYWMFGIILYALLTQSTPFFVEKRNKNRVTQIRDKVLYSNDWIVDGLGIFETIIIHLLKKKPRQRWGGEEVQQYLIDIMYPREEQLNTSTQECSESICSSTEYRSAELIPLDVEDSSTSKLPGVQSRFCPRVVACVKKTFKCFNQDPKPITD